jgi:hypothetical protein
MHKVIQEEKLTEQSTAADTQQPSLKASLRLLGAAERQRHAIGACGFNDSNRSRPTRRNGRRPDVEILSGRPFGE